MSNFRQDLQYGFRLLLKSPNFTFAAAVALALGIGTNTVIFSAVESVLLRPLPFPDPERLVLVSGSAPLLGYPELPFSFPGFTDLTQQNHVFDHVGGWLFWTTASWNYTGAGDTEVIPGAYVSSSFFSVLKAKPLLGRTFLPAEDEESGQRVVVVSQQVWQRSLNSDSGIIGKPMLLDGNSYTIIGVMPAQFTLPTIGKVPEAWLPLSKCPDLQRNARGLHNIGVIGRLKPGVSATQAQAEMNLIAKQQQDYSNTIKSWGIRVVPLHQHLARNLRQGLYILLGAAGFVALIICTNVANLLLSRSTARRKEIAMRVALGASRWRIIQQLLTESILLTAIGGVGGMVLAVWGIWALKSIRLGSPDPFTPFSMLENRVGLNGSVLVFTLIFSLLTGIVFGLAPALRASKTDLSQSLKDAGQKSSGGVSRDRSRSLLIISQIALSVTLLIGAGLLLKSFLHLLKVNPGFNPNNILTVDIKLPQTKYQYPPPRSRFYEQVLQRIKALPGVVSAGMIEYIPLTGDDNGSGFQIDGQPPPPPEKMNIAQHQTASTDYFQAMRIQLVQGRFFTERDDWFASRVMLINESMARRYWPNENPLGKRIIPSTQQVPHEIVGIVKDVKHFGLNAETPAQMYSHYSQNIMRDMTLVIRTTNDPIGLIDAVRREVLAVDGKQGLANVQTMVDRLSNSVAKPRYLAMLFALFSILALILVAIGIYGVVSFSVTQRTQEIGIRMALGATSGDVLKLVLGQAIILTLIGMVTGLGLAMALTRLMSKLLYGVNPMDPTMILGASLLLIAVSLLASYIPARRAIMINPVSALRYE